MAQTEQSEQEREGSPAESFPMLLCTEKGQEYELNMGQLSLTPAPRPPHTISSSGAAVPQSLFEELWVEIPGPVLHPADLLHLTPVSHVDFAHLSDLEPWS